MQPLQTCRNPRCGRTAHPHGYGHCKPHAYQAGIFRQLVSAIPVSNHINDLLDAGWTAGAIATAANVSSSTVRRIIIDPHRRIKSDSAAALLAVTDVHNGDQPTWRARRRIQSLLAAGHTLDTIAHEADLCTATIQIILRGNQERIRFTTHRSILTAYEHLEMRPIQAPAPQAVGPHWPLPLEWDNIDDPHERRDPLTREDIETQTPLTEECSSQAHWILHETGSYPAASSCASVGIRTLRAAIAAKPNCNIAAESAHRIKHAAIRLGWTPGTQEVAA